MRKLILIALVVALIIGGAWFYLVSTTPKTGAGVTFPLTAQHRALLLHVPVAAEAFALVPHAAVLHGKLLANPITREPVQKWLEEKDVPAPWVIGGANVVAWRDGKQTSYAFQLDPFRAFLMRIWMMWSSDVKAQWTGEVFVVNSKGGETIAPAALDELLALANGLPAGDAFAVQLDRARSAFPPLPRPAVTSMQVTAGEIVLTSRAKRDEDTKAGPVMTNLPQGAVLTESFAAAPRALNDLDRLVGRKVSALAGAGGAVAIYEIDTGTLLPKPEGVIIVPADAERRQAIADIERLSAGLAETRDLGSELLLSFDSRSIDMYIKDTKRPLPWGANVWAVRVDPERMIPVLERLSDSTGFRIAAPRLFRSARDLRQWIGVLRHAQTIEAAASAEGDFEQLRARVASK